MKVCLTNLAHMHTMDAFIRHGAKTPSGPAPPHYRGFKITLSLRRITLGRTPLDEWWDRPTHHLRMWNTIVKQVSSQSRS